MNNNKKILLILSAVIMLAISFSFVQINESEPTPRNTRALYMQYCASCHGENLNRFAARKWVYGNTVKDVSSTLKHGRPAIGMPEFAKAMTDVEIQALAIYTIENVAQLPTLAPAVFDVSSTIESLDLTFRLEEVAGGNLKIPWGTAFLPNGDLLVTEKSGVLYQVSKGAMIEVKGLPTIFVRGQGGLMDVAVHPQFKKNNFIYLAYADGKDANSLNTSIGRGVLKNGKISKFQRIMHALPETNSSVHFGCRIIFDKDGYLYFSIGERGKKENAQDLTNHCGKIHRIHDDGSIPTDNPFVNNPNAVKSIWSYGHRNPQGLFYDKKTGIIWENEHGQNMVGVPRVKIPMKKGQTLVIRFAEMLNTDGSMYTANYRSAKSTNYYTAKEDGVINYTPTFTFYGFRYIEIKNFDKTKTPQNDWITSLVQYSDFDANGTFTSSHAKLNQLQSNINWGLRGNFLDIPTDCPQRDERMGWTGDAQVFARTSIYNADVLSFWASWLQTMRDDQFASGSIPIIVPNVAGDRVSSGWGDACTIIPWDIYQYSGNTKILADNYLMMKNWVRFYKSKANNHI